MLTAIIQARLRSTRLPGKALLDLGGAPMLQRVIDRVVRTIPNVLVATPDDEIAEFCDGRGIASYVGHEHDVLSRYYDAAVLNGADPVVRVTSDCPFVDSTVLQHLLDVFAVGEFDYVSVATGSPGGQFPRVGLRYPDGLDAEIFSLATLRRAWTDTLHPTHREHVTTAIWSDNTYRVGHVFAPTDLGQFRFTVDTEDDLAFARLVYAEFGPDCTFVQALDVARRV